MQPHTAARSRVLAPPRPADQPRSWDPHLAAPYSSLAQVLGSLPGSPALGPGTPIQQSSPGSGPLTHSSPAPGPGPPSTAAQPRVLVPPLRPAALPRVLVSPTKTSSPVPGSGPFRPAAKPRVLGPPDQQPSPRSWPHTPSACWDTVSHGGGGGGNTSTAEGQGDGTGRKAGQVTAPTQLSLRHWPQAASWPLRTVTAPHSWWLTRNESRKRRTGAGREPHGCGEPECSAQRGAHPRLWSQVDGVTQASSVPVG